MMGEERDGSCGKPTDKKAGNVALIEANIDDMTGESLAFAAKKLMEESALDVWITPIIMKRDVLRMLYRVCANWRIKTALLK